MERKLQTHIDNYVKDFKGKVRDILLNENNKSANDKLEEIFEIPTCMIDIKAFSRKKRVRNVIADSERCCAYKAAHDRCTRKRRDGHNVCGTHLKGTPHGMINSEIEENTTKKRDVYTLDIGGIIYYVDNEKNVYSSTEIMNGKSNPTKIGKYIVNSNGQTILVNN